MMRTCLLAALLASSTAQAQCYLDSRTDTRGVTTLDGVTVLSREITVNEFAWRTCTVTTQGRVGDREYLGIGEASWQNGSPAGEHCAIAQRRSIENLREQAGRLEVNSQHSLDCSDRPENRAIERRPIQIASHMAVGYRAPLHEFRIYNRSRPFSHRGLPGSRCFEFLNHMNHIGGVVCQTTDHQIWQVVDVNIYNRIQ
jgi:hypothetical protein